MYVKEIKFNGAEYKAILKLRSTILRTPLGKKLSSIDTIGEEDQLHFGCMNKDQLIGCIVVKPSDKEDSAKLRQMAVDASFQGKGVGKQLISYAENHLKEKGFKNLELSARKSAQVFYKKLGYETIGEFYLEQGIEHIKMYKII
ncbi:MAG: GNAT family N-acetyltransferase [Gammaproteobacteria bacterium]|jgi:predicted GNAT family N-acyltransferase|nr:GNAT family N-acetyltransferase [Gammaproteobacteria bacterium]